MADQQLGPEETPSRISRAIKYLNPLYTLSRIKQRVIAFIEKIKAMRKHPIDRFRLTLFLGAGFLVLLFLGTVGVPLTSGPRFCGEICHSQAPEYNSWKKNNHNKTTCYACHEPPGLHIILWAKISGGPRDIYQEITKTYPDPINGNSHLSTTIPSINCRRCHTPENRKFTTGGLKTAHLKHVNEKIDCAYCHNRVAHKQVRGYINRTHEIFCIKCHTKEESKKAGAPQPEQCERCHVYKRGNF